MNLQPVLEYVATQNLGVRGRDLFRYFMPSDIDEGILITSQMPHPLNPYLPGKYMGDFQVIVRGIDVDEVRSRAVSLLKALTLRSVTMGEMRFFYIQPRHAPLVYPKSDGNYIEASVNFECQYFI